MRGGPQERVKCDPSCIDKGGGGCKEVSMVHCRSSHLLKGREDSGCSHAIKDAAERTEHGWRQAGANEDLIS